MQSKKKLVIIIPAFNEASTIVNIVKAVPRSVEGVDCIEILVVNDGSTDDTVSKVKSETNASIVSHSCNRGVGAAFHTGVNYALGRRADFAVNVDADGQFSPEDISKLLRPLINNEADSATASRFVDAEYIPQMPKVRLWGNRWVSRIISCLIGQKFYDVSCGFRAYNKEALLNLNLFGNFTYVQESFLDLSFKGMRIKEVPVRVRYFTGRKSRIFKGAFQYAINISKIIFGTLRDYRPLKFFGSIGLFIFALGLPFDWFMLVYYLKTGAFSPHKAVGLSGILLNIIGLGTLFLALVIDMLYRVRMNQEKLLYYAKRQQFYGKNNGCQK